MQTILLLFVLLLLLHKKRKQRKRKRTIWVQPWIDNRLTHGAYNALVLELDGQSYKNFLRMDRSSFDLFLEKVRPVIEPCGPCGTPHVRVLGIDC